MLHIGRPIRFIVVELDVNGNVRSVAAPTELAVTSEAVEAALTDAETLIRTSGPANALDRVHTALHGYLEAICDREFIFYEDDASITALFGAIRRHHPAIQSKDPQAQQMSAVILRGMAGIIDSLNLVRNKKTPLTRTNCSMNQKLCWRLMPSELFCTISTKSSPSSG
jgi:hypothetical protein